MIFFEKTSKNRKTFFDFPMFFQNYHIDFSMKIFKIFDSSKKSRKIFFDNFFENVFDLIKNILFLKKIYSNPKLSEDSKNHTQKIIRSVQRYEKCTNQVFGKILRDFGSVLCITTLNPLRSAIALRGIALAHVITLPFAQNPLAPAKIAKPLVSLGERLFFELTNPYVVERCHIYLI